jgi:hypothetical protein
MGIQSVLTFFSWALQESVRKWCKCKWWNRLSHFVWQFRALRSWILQIWKFFHISEDLKILAPFSDLQYSTSECPNLHAKYPNIFRPGSVRISVWVPGRSVSIHFASQFGALTVEVEYCKSESSGRFPQDFRILELFSDFFYLSLSVCLTVFLCQSFRPMKNYRRVFYSRNQTDKRKTAR